MSKIVSRSLFVIPKYSQRHVQRTPGGVSILPEVRGHQRSETSQKYGNNFTKHVFSDLEMKLMEVARFISQKFGQ